MRRILARWPEFTCTRRSARLAALSTRAIVAAVAKG
jgi:hypothetical protein